MNRQTALEELRAMALKVIADLKADLEARAQKA